MEELFDRQARIAALLAEAEAVDWCPDWMPDPEPQCMPGWDPAAGQVPAAGSGVGMGFGVETAAGADGDPDLDDTDSVVRRWRVEQVVALRAEISRLQALEHRQLAALAQTVQDALPPGVGGEDLQWAFRSLTAELAVACRVSTATMQARLAEAHLMVACFPATLQALQEGRVEAGHVRTITVYGGCIEDGDTRAEYERLVLQKAALVTPGRLARYAQLTAASVGTVSFQDRHRRAREGRWVRLSTDDDGMSTLSLYVPTVLGQAVWDRLTAQTTAIHNDTSDGVDPRSFDQIRTDLATELLLIGQPSGDPDAPHKAGVGIRAEVSVVIPMLTLLGQGGDPAVLAGGTPIGMDDALRLAADTPEWVRVLTDPVSGMVLNVERYRPSKRLRRYLRIRDGRCRFPVCHRATQRSEIDHTLDWHYGGKTAPGNLECLCKGHHRFKHHSPWKVKQVTPGVLEWTSPLGQVITDLPDTDIPGSTAPF